MGKIRVGLIGFGAWTRNAYLCALRYDGRAVVTAVTAATERTRKLAREILGNSATVYDNFELLLKRAEIDAVMIAVPDEAHQAVLSVAIDSGIPVFYEPPIAVKRDQIPIMLNSLLRAKQITYADLELGCHPMIYRAIELIENNMVGCLHNVTITLHAGWGPSDSDLCLMNRMSCWYVDILNQIIGKIPKRVLVLDGYGNTGRMQAISTAVYDYDRIWGVFKANIYSQEDLSINIEISGDEGIIYLNYFTGEIRYRSIKDSYWIVEACPSLTPYADWPGVRESVSTFLDIISSGEASRGNAKKVAQLNIIGLAADESKDLGAWAEVQII
ncbi:Predicted dehydrogenase [Anaerovirgula multivorans]|uniref:Predicted dehydrogenase n=1 Tax=Anaerovirgula multivorans TaxID=312168 RepID=A0A239DGU7_9FIRM|nr:Gfo/Idh/MocA family oxidoreductase [Anaerovirgula multivorans]SNS31232.1 Predicted dehydrogenase [Anaerovirgula multivorans]